MQKERHVLVIFPHPDDETYGAGGTIASYTSKGIPVTYACLTLGEMGRNFGNPPIATRESLVNIRKKELKKACEILGIQDLRMLGFHDKTIEFENDDEVTAVIYDIIQQLNPSLIISFYPGYCVHPDHEATARAVIRALRKFPDEKRPTLHCVAFSNNHEKELGKPHIEVNISE